MAQIMALISQSKLHHKGASTPSLVSLVRPVEASGTERELPFPLPPVAANADGPVYELNVFSAMEI